MAGRQAKVLSPLALARVLKHVSRSHSNPVRSRAIVLLSVKAGLRAAEIADAMLLLAQTEGIFAETAGGVTLAVTQKLIAQGKIPRDEEIVVCITGNGLKTQDAIADLVEKPAVIRPNIDDFAAVLDGEREAVLV